MNGQQSNHSGMSGYAMTPQQQQAMMQQHQYSRMLNQQQQQQQQSLPQQPTLPQQTQQSMYSQNFYQQGYIHNIQAHGLLSNSHINNQQMALPQQQQQQFYAAQQQFQQQISQDSLPQTQHHLQQYNPHAIYQQDHLSHQQHIPQSQPQTRQPTESMHHLSQNPSHQSAFSQPLPQQSQQQSSQQHASALPLHYYNPQQQQRLEYATHYKEMGSSDYKRVVETLCDLYKDDNEQLLKLFGYLKGEEESCKGRQMSGVWNMLASLLDRKMELKAYADDLIKQSNNAPDLEIKFVEMHLAAAAAANNTVACGNRGPADYIPELSAIINAAISSKTIPIFKLLIFYKFCTYRYTGFTFTKPIKDARKK